MRTTTYLIIFSLIGIFISQSLENVLEETRTPAAGIALVNKDGPVWVTGLGKADIENNTAANETLCFG